MSAPMDVTPSEAATQGAVVARREVCEYGLLPVQSFFPRLDGPAAVLLLVRKLHAVAKPMGEPSAAATAGSRFVSVADVASVMGLCEATTKIIINTLEGVVPESAVVQDAGGDGPTAVSIHALALFLFIQLHSRQGTLATVTEVWPAAKDLECHEAPLSPTKRQSPNTSPARGKKVKHQQNRKWFQEQLQHHLQHLAAFPAFIRRNLGHLLLLVLDTLPPGNELPAGAITAREVDRLGMLLRPTDPAKASLNVSQLLGDISTADTAPLQLVQQWLQANTAEAEAEAGASEAARRVKGGGLGPGTVTKRAGMVDMQGIVKGTVVRGEDLCPGGELRISDCHDVVIYALTPLKLASIFGCSDTTIVLGPVGQFLRIERCERLQLIVATKRITISTCHDCTFFLGVNRPPCLIGDSRFIQMAPYCTQYDALGGHMASVGVVPSVNKWDQAITVAHTNHSGSSTRLHAPDSPKTAAAHTMFGNTDGMMIGRSSWTLLPPNKLLPFVIPFKGAPGHLGGGGTGAPGSPPKAPTSAQAPGPFPLPPAYEQALSTKVQGVADLRQAVKSAVLEEQRKKELQAVIQAHFKEWLVNSGNMRQIYDLARLEREEG
eukprot:jgi/Tetstr1/447688/TSEL_035046.t1